MLIWHRRQESNYFTTNGPCQQHSVPISHFTYSYALGIVDAFAKLPDKQLVVIGDGPVIGSKKKQ
jgi:hypothetical protein